MSQISTKETIVAFLFCFWALLAVFSNIFAEAIEQPLSNTDVTEIYDTVESSDTKTGLGDWIFDGLDDIPIVKYFVPFLKMISFQYSENIPPSISIFLGVGMILSTLVFVELVRGD